MPDLMSVLPCFKEPEWPGSANTVCHRVRLDVESTYLPWIAYGFDEPHTFAFLSKAQLVEMGKTERDAERFALRNLRLRKATWQPHDVKLGFFKKLRMLVCMDDYFSAERILDVGFMKEAQSKLGVKALAVGVPRRGVMFVVNADEAPERLTGFVGMVSAQYHRGESPPITPGVFAVMDGNIVGMLQGGEESGRALVDSADDEDEDQDESGAYVQGLVVKDEASGLESVHICAGGVEIESLGNAIQAAFQQVLQKHVPRPEFGGEIVVVILGMTPPAVKATLPSLESHLQGILKETRLKTPAGRPVTVRFEEQPAT